MANIHDCIQRAVDAGELDRERGDAARSQFDQLRERYATIMPSHAADAAARADLQEATRRAARQRHHMVVNQLQAMRRLRTLMERADDPARQIKSLLEFKENSGFEGESVASLRRAYEKMINNDIQEVLRRTGTGPGGRSRDPALLRDIVRELHLEDTGKPQAREMAAAVRRAQDRMRKLFNAHGGDIGELADFGVSHAHDMAKIRAAGFRAWAEEVHGRLDWSRILDRDTGRPFADSAEALPDFETVRPFLARVHETMATGGWNTREPSMAVQGRALYNRRAEARELHFRSGSDWLEYNRKFGVADPFSSMMGGLHGMARDVALMRVLGPNPRTGLEYAVQVARKRAATAQDAAAEGRVAKAEWAAKAMLDQINGTANTPAAGYEAWAAFFAGTRKFIVSTKLGAAVLSATSDTATLATGAANAGMGRTSVVSRHTQLMASQATRAQAARMGYIADTLADAGSTAARFTGDMWAPELADRLSNFTLRASGMNFWTDMARLAFQMEFAGLMADNAGRAWQGIDAPLRRTLEKRGITAEEWDRLRAKETLFRTERGETFLSPFYWLERTDMPRAEAEALATRLQAVIEEEMELAVPTRSVEATAFATANTKPATTPGELTRSTAMFKSFMLSLTLGQIRRIQSKPTLATRAAYAAEIAAGLTAFGAIAVQLKEMAKGNDPRPMNTGKFWGAAALQGGGLGIFGDFFASETSRFGGGLAETASGPVVGLVSDVVGPVASNARRAFEGEDTLIGRDIANLLRYQTPVASSLWYQRAAWDRMVADQLQLILDPEAETAFRRSARRKERDYGTEAWWERGEMAPARAPDFSNALEGSR